MRDVCGREFSIWNNKTNYLVRISMGNRGNLEDLEMTQPKCNKRVEISHTWSPSWVWMANEIDARKNPWQMDGNAVWICKDFL